MPTSAKNATKKAHIKRATKTAQDLTTALDADAMATLLDIYQDVASDIKKRIKASGGASDTVTVEKLARLKPQLQTIITQLSSVQQAALDDYMRTGAQYGGQPFNDHIDKQTIDKTVNRSLLAAKTFVSDDGLQLSERLWRMDRNVDEIVNKRVQQAVIMGQSATQVAQDFLAAGDKVPTHIANQIGAANATQLADEVASKLTTGAGNPYDNALRVFRTEINRAHIMAYRNTAFEDDDVIGTKFKLSKNHRKKDICDMHARVNRYGLGPGVYPRGKSPLPAHPNTISYEVAIYKDEITEADKQGAETRIEWLKKQTADDQHRVLGAEKKRQALAAGILKENQIATPWRVLEQRYKRQGIDVNFPTVVHRQPYQVEHVTTGSAIGVPVSKAFDIRSHKQVSKNILDAINSVHGDGLLNKIPINNYRGDKALGMFYYQIDGNAIEIKLNAAGPAKEFTLAHEIGHFLDYSAITKTKGYASIDAKSMSQWREAIAQSDAIQTLVNYAYHQGLYIGTDGKPYELNRRYITYLLSTQEIWARAYSQYIALRSGDEMLMSQLRYHQDKSQRALIHYPTQWTDSDFASIAAIMDELFIKLGWRKRD